VLGAIVGDRLERQHVVEPERREIGLQRGHPALEQGGPRIGFEGVTRLGGSPRALRRRRVASPVC
jgi:hypothetical protein